MLWDRAKAFLNLNLASQFYLKLTALKLSHWHSLNVNSITRGTTNAVSLVLIGAKQLSVPRYPYNVEHE